MHMPGSKFKNCLHSFVKYRKSYDIAVAFWKKKLLTEFASYVVKRVTWLLQKGSVKTYEYVLSPILFEGPIRLLCMKRDPSLMNVLWSSFNLKSTLLVNCIIM